MLKKHLSKRPRAKKDISTTQHFHVPRAFLVTTAVVRWQWISWLAHKVLVAFLLVRLHLTLLVAAVVRHMCSGAGCPAAAHTLTGGPRVTNHMKTPMAAQMETQMEPQMETQMQGRMDFGMDVGNEVSPKENHTKKTHSKIHPESHSEIHSEIHPGSGACGGAQFSPGINGCFPMWCQRS